MAIESVNPATGERLKGYTETSAADIENALREADTAFHEWRRLKFNDRAPAMKAVAGVLRKRRDEYARLMALEMGKPLTQGQAEIEKCAWVCDYFAEHAQSFLEREIIPTDAAKSFVSFPPLGVILAVMPWNFPFWQLIRCAAPALMAGNGMVLKHASNVPGCALALEQVFQEAGFPDGLFRTLLVESGRVPVLIEHPAIKAVTLTGSVTAGKSIAAQAGAQLKKTVLELGGSDPYVVLEDCDLEKTVELCVKSRLINSGQSCVAAKRFIVVEPVRQRFEELFVSRMQAQRMGDPLADGTTIGPLARSDLRKELHDQVERTLRAGGRLLTGGTIPSGKGWFYPATVLSDVRKGMAAYVEETFGPVAAIISVRDEAQAIEVANDTSFGLGAAVFTQDTERGERIAAEELEAGNCFVNDLVKSDPRLPFGGIKLSGYGRELSAFGIREFVNIKTVYVH